MSCRWISMNAAGVVAVWLLGVAACKEDDWTCAGTPEPGVKLSVLDVRSGANLEELAVVTVDRLLPRSPLRSGPPSDVERLTYSPGTYELRIVATGYAARTDTVTVASQLVNGCEKTVTQIRVVQLTPNQ